MSEAKTMIKTSAPVLDRGTSVRPQGHKLKFMVMTVVCIMVLSGLTLALPIALDDGTDTVDEVPAETMSGAYGVRTTTIIFDQFFEAYLKDNWSYYESVDRSTADFDTLGRHNDTFGLETWYSDPGLRDQYDEYMIRNDSWPLMGYYNPYSTMTSPDRDVGYVIWAPYRMRVDSNYVTECQSDADYSSEGCFFIPVQGNPADLGGNITMKWHNTYLQNCEMAAVRDGTHYANWFFGISSGTTPAETQDDGYWYETKGLIRMDRQAAMGYLGAPSTGDMKAWFNGSASTLTSNWEYDWLVDGSGGVGGGDYDIYTAYDFNNDIRRTALVLDWANSSANTDSMTDYIWFRVWSISWGMDVLMVRYAEVANLLGNLSQPFQGWYEDWDMTLDVNETYANATMSMRVAYTFSATNDTAAGNWPAAWALENDHIDWTHNKVQHQVYRSPYNKYSPDLNLEGGTSADGCDEPSLKFYTPLSTNYGMNVSYWIPPQHLNLSANEQVIVNATTLSNKDVIGFYPKAGTSDTLGSAKTAELRNSANWYWGSLVLGPGAFPSSTIRSNYDATNKNITLTGPLTLPAPALSTNYRLTTGVPTFLFDVSKATQYDVQVTGSHMTTVADTVTVTAKNSTATITDWNGTVDLTCTDSGATLGATSHTFVPSDNGVWSTTVTWATAGQWYVNATDNAFDLDVTGTSGPVDVVLIPEFATLLIPVLGMMAIFLVFRTKKRREEE